MVACFFAQVGDLLVVTLNNGSASICSRSLFYAFFFVVRSNCHSSIYSTYLRSLLIESWCPCFLICNWNLLDWFKCGGTKLFVLSIVNYKAFGYCTYLCDIVSFEQILALRFIFIVLFFLCHCPTTRCAGCSCRNGPKTHFSRYKRWRRELEEELEVNYSIHCWEKKEG